MPQRAQEAPSRRDTNARTTQMVQLLSEIGPDIPEIARRLGQFKESVRYRYKEKILEKGLAVQAMVNHESLGLRRVFVIVDFAPEYRPYAETILTVMSELCYVVSFRRTFPRGRYNVEASVPAEFVNAFLSLMKSVEGKGIFSLLTTCTFDWFRNIPMQAQFYDFDTGRWDFDWSSHHAESSAAKYGPSKSVKFDYVDLLILKELWLDATRPMVEISEKIKINYKKLVWHYRTHVLPLQLIKGYTLRWPGTRYDFALDKALHRQHRYFWVDLLVTDLNEKERMGLMAKLHRIPFLWAEACGESYFAQFAFPVDFFTEAMQYLEEALSDVRERTEIYLPDQTHALALTIGYKLYDENEKRWTFDPLAILKGFDTLILRIKEEGRESA